MLPLLAQTAVAHSLTSILIDIFILAVIFCLLWWAVLSLPLPAPFAQVLRVLLIVALVLALISLILPLLGVRF
jgi:hypothetical protein